MSNHGYHKQSKLGAINNAMSAGTGYLVGGRSIVNGQQVMFGADQIMTWANNDLNDWSNNMTVTNGVYNDLAQKQAYEVLKSKIAIAAQLTNSPERTMANVVVTGKQFIIVCNGVSETADTRTQADDAAANLAHRFQTEAIILAPVAKTTPKRDVTTTEITL